MLKVLTLAYMFPPIGGAGVQRNSKFVRYLPEFGYQPIVVTGPGEIDDHWTPTDRSLTTDIPELAVVHRLPNDPPPSEGPVRGALGRALMLDSRRARWWITESASIGVKLAPQSELIYASLVPYETAHAAVRIASQSDKPWIADLQDPWALDEMWLYPSSLHRRVDTQRMGRLLLSASAIVMNTPEAAQRVMKAFPELRRKRIVAIPNGFDAADFSPTPHLQRSEKFRIVHTGYLHTEAGLRLRQVKWARRLLGGWTSEVDILTRSHVYLIQALNRVIHADPAAADEIEIVLAGVLTDADRAVAGDAPVRITMPGYVDHTTSVALIQSADLLFLPMHDLPDGARAGLVPGKTYEYLASGRPILAAVPDGDARDLLQRSGTARLCRPKDVEAMATAIHEQLALWRSGDPGPQLIKDAVAGFERRELTRQLADLFSSVLSDDR